MTLAYVSTTLVEVIRTIDHHHDNEKPPEMSQSYLFIAAFATKDLATLSAVVFSANLCKFLRAEHTDLYFIICSPPDKISKKSLTPLLC